jgi:hypothetical protein
MPRKRRPKIFSATKAVKANARERLGTPPPSSPIPDRRTKQDHGPRKHKQKLEEIIANASKDDPA